MTRFEFRLTLTSMGMKVVFLDRRIEALETLEGDGGYPPGVLKTFKMRIAFIRHAQDERDLYAMKSLHYEKLKGKREHQHSVRLNDQWRIILEVAGKGAERTVAVVGIEDYH